MAREDAIADYIHELASFLGHHYWAFRVSAEYAGEDSWAEIQIAEYNEAEVKLSHRFWQADSAEKTQILIHELLHISFSRTHEHIEDAMDSLLDWLNTSDRKRAKVQMDIHRDAAERAEEVEVNRLAVLLAKFAPKMPIDIE